MKANFEILKTARQHFVAILDAFSNEQLNKIPTGFNNNLIWNIGHVVVTQQLLHYTLSGVAPKISPEMISKYRKGSSGAIQAGEDEVNLIKKLLVEMPEQLEKDYENDFFGEYKEYPTSFKFTLDSIEKAILFNNVHEGMHFGIVMSLKKHV
jgi:hypothetical protein